VMDGSFASGSAHLARLAAPAKRIQQVQLADGRIPWFEDGPWDPWNHVECAMALTAMGALDASADAFDHLADAQRRDGAWLGEYGNVLPMVDRDYISREPAPAFLDSNFCAYPAVGVLHYLLATGDLQRVRDWWPMVRHAIDFVLALQRTDGTISWSFEAMGTDEDDALLAGNSSIAKSLECAIRLAVILGEDTSGWIAARKVLVHALRHRPDVFDRKGRGARFAMDWYYPVLSGALTKIVAKRRIEAGWETFVAPAHGCRCVSYEPWVTVAETAELAMALISVGDRQQAEALLRKLDTLRDTSGVYWMGWQYVEHTVWPKEAPTWTQAAVILADGALRGSASHSRVLVEPVL
jgi:hypothetical protein